MLIEEQGATLGQRKHEAPLSNRRVQFCSDGLNSLKGTQKSEYCEAQGQNRRPCKRCKWHHRGTDCQGVKVKCRKCKKHGHYSYECRSTLASTTESKPCGQNRRPCKQCKRHHPRTDCQGMKFICSMCSKVGHRSFECRTTLASKTVSKGRKGGDQVKQSNCNLCGKNHPSTDCQDNMIGCRICGRLGHRYFDCPSIAAGVIQRSHSQAHTLDVQQQPQHETRTAPDNTQCGESKGNVQTPRPYPDNVGQTSEVGNDIGASGMRQNAVCLTKADRRTDVISATVAVQKIIPDMSKVKPLEGSNYRRWSQRMLILFEALEVDYVLLEDPPIEKNSDKTPATRAGTTMPATSKGADAKRKEKYEKDNKMVRSHLLAHMNNVLFDLFIGYSLAKEIWEMLKKLYEGDTGKKKDVVGNWLHFVMVDNKPIMEQIHEYENLVADILGEGMKICETFQAQVLLEKVPPSWSDFCNHLEHKNFSLQELIDHMQTEEAIRLEANRLVDRSNGHPQKDRPKSKRKKSKGGISWFLMLDE